MFMYLYAVTMLIFQIKRIISSEKWSNYVATFFFLKMPKIWVGRTTVKGEKKEDGLSLLACENIRFSSLFAAGNVSRGGTSATQRQKFHTDGANQCLHNKSGSHGVPNINLSNFTCLLVDFSKV